MQKDSASRESVPVSADVIRLIFKEELIPIKRHFDERFDKVEQRLDKVEDGIDALHDYVDEHFNMIDERFNELGIKRWTAVFEEKNAQED